MTIQLGQLDFLFIKRREELLIVNSTGIRKIYFNEVFKKATLLRNLKRDILIKVVSLFLQFLRKKVGEKLFFNKIEDMSAKQTYNTFKKSI